MNKKKDKKKKQENNLNAVGSQSVYMETKRKDATQECSKTKDGTFDRPWFLAIQ